jgi:transcriptional regulator with XRE-family HTH domain
MPSPNLSLQQHRNRAAKSMRKLADEAGVSAMTVSRIERGLFLGTDDTLRKLAAALGIDVAQIGGRAA